MEVLQGKLFALHAVLKSASKLRDVLKELADNASAYIACLVMLKVCVFSRWLLQRSFSVDLNM